MWPPGHDEMMIVDAWVFELFGIYGNILLHPMGVQRSNCAQDIFDRIATEAQLRCVGLGPANDLGDFANKDEDFTRNDGKLQGKAMETHQRNSTMTGFR